MQLIKRITQPFELNILCGSNPQDPWLRGREFQTLGDATEKLRAPDAVRANGIGELSERKYRNLTVDMMCVVDVIDVR